MQPAPCAVSGVSAAVVVALSERTLNPGFPEKHESHAYDVLPPWVLTRFALRLSRFRGIRTRGFIK